MKQVVDSVPVLKSGRTLLRNPLAKSAAKPEKEKTLEERDHGDIRARGEASNCRT